jgi:undecaprenyl-diphosphatase
VRRPARKAVRAAGAGDRWLLGRAARRRSRALDDVLVTSSAAADHSSLWILIACVLAAAGGRRGQRAAVGGVAAIALASGTVNGPLKFAIQRRRPTRPHRRLRRVPRTSSFPSGHSASAFAFGTAVSRELPIVSPLLFALAGTVAFSRVYLRVHYPSDVVLGSAIGALAGLAAGEAVDRIPWLAPTPAELTGDPRLPAEAVIVVSSHAGHGRGLGRAQRELQRLGIPIVEELRIEDVDRVPELLRDSDGRPRLIIAAGGDGTVGTVADRLANTDSVLGVLPLGTSNDFARSLGIPVHPERAVRLFRCGKVATVDLGRLDPAAQPPRHFAHAATVGLNVSFAKLATRASVRDHLGRLTYLVAATGALRHRPSFECELRYEGEQVRLTLAQLSVINAPTFGGALGMKLGGSSADDRLLDVLAIEAQPVHRIVLAGLILLLHLRREVRGARALHVPRLHVQTDQPLEVALDGEIAGTLPGDFEVVGEGLSVVTPQEFDDMDDD